VRPAATGPRLPEDPPSMARGRIALLGQSARRRVEQVGPWSKRKSPRHTFIGEAGGLSEPPRPAISSAQFVRYGRAAWHSSGDIRSVCSVRVPRADRQCWPGAAGFSAALRVPICRSNCAAQ
jgi:hypothetical protein